MLCNAPAVVGKPPNVKRLVLRAIPDEATRLAALKRGEVDIVYQIRGALAEDLRRSPGLTQVSPIQKAARMKRELGARIPSVRTPVASLSGGQRQVVAIARSLIGDPSLVILDEPTAALGVAQTAEVLNLIERLRERGLGVILISHNIADVQAVADRIVVLRLGRNNGEFRVADVTSEQIIAAITGASDHSIGRVAPPRRVP